MTNAFISIPVSVSPFDVRHPLPPDFFDVDTIGSQSMWIPRNSEGVIISRQSRLSLTYFEGESIFASCAFITTTRKSIMHDNNSRQLQRQINVSPAFTVNYTLKCFEKQWIIKSSPENISWRSCPKPGKDIAVTAVKATSLDDSMFVPVLFENQRSNCYTGAIDIPQKWVISLSHEVYPCFISIILSTPGRQRLSSSSSTLQVMDESGNYNCSFLRYIYESMIEVQREKTRRNLRALFICSSRVPDLITSERPGIQSLRYNFNRKKSHRMRTDIHINTLHSLPKYLFVALKSMNVPLLADPSLFLSKDLHEKKE